MAECVALLASGREIWLPIRAGVHTAEWAWERPDVRPRSATQRAPILQSFPVRDGFEGHQYLGVLRLPGRFAVEGLRFRAWPGAPPLTLLKAGLRDGQTGRDQGVGLASGYLSDEVRLMEAAGTPLVTLFEVRRGVGPARVVSSLRRLPDDRRVRDFLALADPARGRQRSRGARGRGRRGRRRPCRPEAVSSGAVVARARGGRLVVRAAGPGLLVLVRGMGPRLARPGSTGSRPAPCESTATASASFSARAPTGWSFGTGPGGSRPASPSLSSPRSAWGRSWRGMSSPGGGDQTASEGSRFDPSLGRVLAWPVSRRVVDEPRETRPQHLLPRLQRRRHHREPGSGGAHDGAAAHVRPRGHRGERRQPRPHRGAPRRDGLPLPLAPGGPPRDEPGLRGRAAHRVRTASKELVFYTDGDAQYDPREMERLLRGLRARGRLRERLQDLPKRPAPPHRHRPPLPLVRQARLRAAAARRGL